MIDIPDSTKPGENADFKRRVSSIHEGGTRVNQLFRFAFKRNERVLVDVIITEINSISRYYKIANRKNWNATPKNKLVAAVDAMAELLPELRGKKKFNYRRLGVTTDFDQWTKREQLLKFAKALRDSLGDKLEENEFRSYGVEAALGGVGQEQGHRPAH